jgi:hypothetical protein
MILSSPKMRLNLLMIFTSMTSTTEPTLTVSTAQGVIVVIFSCDFFQLKICVWKFVCFTIHLKTLII